MDDVFPIRERDNPLSASIGVTYLNQISEVEMKAYRFAPMCLLGLAACSGAPSDSDMKTALQRNVDQTVGALLGNGQAARDAKPTYDAVKSLGCKSDGEKAYRCDVEVEMTSILGKQKNAQSIRFVKGSDGWIASM